MELPELYQAAVSAHDAARPYCIAYLAYDPDTCEQKLVLWRRYSTARKARCEPQLKGVAVYNTGNTLFVLKASEFEKVASEYYEPPIGEDWDEDLYRMHAYPKD